MLQKISMGPWCSGLDVSHSQNLQALSIDDDLRSGFSSAAFLRLLCVSLINHLYLYGTASACFTLGPSLGVMLHQNQLAGSDSDS